MAYYLYILFIVLIIYLNRHNLEQFPSIGHQIHGDVTFMKCIIGNENICHGSNKGPTGFVYYN